MEKVSIIIPVYNAELYLNKCIDSVLYQDNIEIEVILINDGSTDNSGNICDDYSIKDKRIKVFHQINGGVSSARNKGLENATGEWVCFVDADDWIENNSISRILNKTTFIDSDIIIARSFTVRGNSTYLENYSFNRSWEGLVFKGTNLYIKEKYVRGSVCGVLFKRLFLKQNKILFPLNLKNGEDSIFFTFCILFAMRICFSNTHLYNVYERERSASRNWSFDRILLMVNNIDFINNYINTHTNLSPEAIMILNHAKYLVISNIYYNFHNTISLKHYLRLRRSIKRSIQGKIDIGDITKSRNKVGILNLSIDIFAIMVMLKNSAL